MTERRTAYAKIAEGMTDAIEGRTVTRQTIPADLVAQLRAYRVSSGGESCAVMLHLLAAEEIERLRAALAKHGRHTSDCRHLGGFDCNCGWEELLRAI